LKQNLLADNPYKEPFTVDYETLDAFSLLSQVHIGNQDKKQISKNKKAALSNKSGVKKGSLFSRNEDKKVPSSSSSSSSDDEE
jgi:hypothetical protein